MNRRLAAACTMTVVALSLGIIHAQPASRISEAQARQIAIDSAGSANGDQKKFDKAFVAAAKKLSPEFDDSAPMVLLENAAISIKVVGPVGAFRLLAGESVRKMQTDLSTIPWSDTVTVGVYPSQIGAPDFERVVIKRAGVIVPSLPGGSFAPQELSTAMGAKRTIHQGTILFPASAFDRGAEVEITMIPVAGPNSQSVIPDRMLKKIL